MIEQQIALAIQKPNGKPNLGDESEALLKAGELEFSFKPRVDDALTNIPGLEIVRMKNADLIKSVCEGDVDLAIAGMDMYQEYTKSPKALILNSLGIGTCKLKLGVRQDFEFKDPTSLAGLRVATSYPKETADFFKCWETEVTVRERAGGEETFVKRGKAEACVVISDTGNSLTANGLTLVWPVSETQAFLFANSEINEKRGSERIMWNTLRAITTGVWNTQYTMLEANFPKKLTEEMVATLPSAGSPTISALESGGQAIRSLVPVKTLKESRDKYYAAGASKLVRLKVESVYPDLDDPEINRMMRAIYGEDWKLSHPPYSV